jgi:hypothetical protein
MYFIPQTKKVAAFLGFLERIDEAVPITLDVHLIVDNYSNHKHTGRSQLSHQW